MTSIYELSKDVEDLRRLMSQTSRQSVIDAMSDILSKWESEIKRLSEVKVAQSEKNEDVKQKAMVYHKQVDTYAWDQSPKFLKIYVTVPSVQTLNKNDVTCDFKDRSYKLVVSELNNYTYTNQVCKLLHPISIADSFVKIKTDCVLVMLKKQEEGKTWSHVTQQEQQAKEKSTPDVKKEGDPQDNLMGMLQGMYEEGDDELKRTIKKAFYESRMKKTPGMEGVDDL